MNPFTSSGQPGAAVRVAWLIGLTGLYYAAGRLGLSLAFVHQSATAVWPSSGIALAAVLLLGRWVWPGIAAGAFLVNIATGASLLPSLGIAFGNTVEALIGGVLLERWANGYRAFDRGPDVLWFGILSVIGPIVSATVGVTVLLLSGLLADAAIDWVWLTWWLGDVSGILVVAPVLVLLWTRRRDRWASGHFLESVVLFGLVLAGGWMLFVGDHPLSVGNYPIGFICMPLLLWPAFRFGSREAALSVLALTATAIWGTLSGHGPFGRPDRNEALLLMQMFAGVVAVTTTTIAALVDEGRRLRAELEARVEERTSQLRQANAVLRAEIDERRQAQAALATSEHRLREAQAVAHVGSWEWEVAADAVWWSEELYRIYGVDRGSFAARYESVRDCVHPEDRHILTAAVSAALTEGRAYEIEHRIVRPDGTIRRIAASGRVVHGADGRPVKLLGIAQDVTERVQAEAAERQLIIEQAARREAEQASLLKDQFLAMVSHELRTPLNAVIGWIHMLVNGNLDLDATRRALQIIERNAQAQARLIDDLLDVSRFTAGQVRLDLRSVEVGPLARMALDSIAAEAAARHVHIAACLESSDARVMADPERLRQIVANLLSNAVKFTPDGGHVALAVTTTDSTVELNVRDTGRGIHPSQIGRIFEPFWQAETSHSRTHGGLGLGLAIVRYLVEAHGGTIRAASAGEGQGATFTVTLPRHRSTR